MCSLSAVLRADGVADSMYVGSGKATYYAHSFHGRHMCNGEKYDKNDMTCAHRTLPFGTLVKVVNKRNGKSVVVRVTDRGPYGKGKIVDLSYAAAREIDMIRAGIVTVDVYLCSEKDAAVKNAAGQDQIKKN